MAKPTFVQSNFELSSTRTSDLQTHGNKFDITTRSLSQTLISRKTVTDGGSIIREKYRKLGYSEKHKKHFIGKLETRYTKYYSKYIDLLKEFTSIITINEERCGKHPDVKRFMKGIFELRPTFPKYHMIWDVKKAFNYFRNLLVISDLTLKELSLKLAMLLCFVPGRQRMQTMHLINLKDIKYVGDQVLIPIMQKIKQSKSGDHIYPLSFKTYPKDTKLCVIAHLRRYIALTQDLRSSDKLVISYAKPHQAISKDTISRWCKTVMELSGVDIQKYSTHFTRSAASSNAKSMGTSLKNIIRCAGWKSEKTFPQH